MLWCWQGQFCWQNVSRLDSDLLQNGIRNPFQVGIAASNDWRDDDLWFIIRMHVADRFDDAGNVL